jgi:Tfp pilus assembly protein PilF
MEEMRTILRDNPSHFWSVISLSEMMMQEQKNKEALEIVNKALEVAPNEATFLTLRASVFQNLGEMYT